MAQNLPALNPQAGKEAKSMRSLLASVWDGLNEETQEKALEQFAAINIPPSHPVRQTLLDTIRVNQDALKLAEGMADEKLDKLGVRGIRKMVTGD